MAICPSCRGAKTIPLMGHAGTKKCETCDGKGKGDFERLGFMSTDINESRYSETLSALGTKHEHELELEDKAPIEIPESTPIELPTIISEPEPTPTKNTKKTPKAKNKSKWGL